MKISVVTVCYNAVAEIETTMLSVLNQTHPDVEYIVIDGGSTDGTVEIIRRYASRLTYWVSEPDGGIYDAMNKGIARATGTYINFMNAGDRFASSTVIADVVATSPTATIIYGNTVNEDTRRNRLVLTYPRRLTEMPRWGVFCHQSSFIRVDYHKSHPYDVSFKSLADYDFFRRAYIEHQLTFAYLNMVIAIFDISGGMSTDNIGLNYRELERILGADEDAWKCFKLRIRRIGGMIKRGIGL